MLPTALKLDQTSLVVHQDKIFFYSRSSPFSNFFPSQFDLKGVHYKYVEQYSQSTKTEIHGDQRLTDDIMVADDPAQMHHIGHTVLATDPNIWTDGTKIKTMEEALCAKYEQNPHLKDVLLSTGSKQLVEAGPDTFWGAGITMKDIKDTPEANWPGRNELGQLLMKLRTKFQK